MSKRSKNDQKEKTLPPHLSIRLFGPISIELNDAPITNLGTRKAEALLAFLVSQQRPFPRETLAEMLWDDRPSAQALANFRSLLTGLRKQLKPFLLVTRHTVGFNHESDYWLDTAEFSQLLGIGDWRLEIRIRQSSWDGWISRISHPFIDKYVALVEYFSQL